MAKQPKTDDATKETKAEPTIAETGQTLSVTTPSGNENALVGAAGLPETTDPSDAIIASIEEGKSPKGQIVVIGPKGGRWRAGRHFGPEPTVIDVEDLTEEEGLALIGDPKLIVGPAFSDVPS